MNSHLSAQTTNSFHPVYIQPVLQNHFVNKMVKSTHSDLGSVQEIHSEWPSRLIFSLLTLHSQSPLMFAVLVRVSIVSDFSSNLNYQFTAELIYFYRSQHTHHKCSLPEEARHIHQNLVQSNFIELAGSRDL